MANKPERDDSWDQISPMFARLVNDPELIEHERRTNRLFWGLAIICAAVAGAFCAAEWYWGDGAIEALRIAVKIGGAAVLLGFVVLCVLAVFQKRKG